MEINEHTGIVKGDNWKIIHLPTFAEASEVKIKYLKSKPFRVLHKNDTLHFRDLDSAIEYLNESILLPPFKIRQIYELYANI